MGPPGSGCEGEGRETFSINCLTFDMAMGPPGSGCEGEGRETFSINCLTFDRGPQGLAEKEREEKHSQSTVSPLIEAPRVWLRRRGRRKKRNILNPQRSLANSQQVATSFSTSSHGLDRKKKVF